ncbi:MAG TPA: hypothetical protein VK629_20590 [Steroidobacteraceae bacterium]|nr:hypothetical protein [Steroidobacteraceae bacterium]
MSANDPAFEAERKRRIRRSVILLTLVALAFYVGFIAVSVSRV